MTADEFRQRYPVLAHYSPSLELAVDDGLLTAAQILDRCADTSGNVWARFKAENEFSQYPVGHWKVRSRFRRRAGEVGSNLIVQDSQDHSLTFILGNNYPLGDGSCLGSTIALTDNRDPNTVLTREDWFSLLNSMFWVFSADDVNEGVIRHLRDASVDGELHCVRIQTPALSEEFIEDRIRLSAINGGGSNGAMPRGTATYRRPSEWHPESRAKEIGVVNGFSPGEVQLLKSAGALTVCREALS
jgi:hypothetical protein